MAEPEIVTVYSSMVITNGPLVQIFLEQDGIASQIFDVAPFTGAYHELDPANAAQIWVGVQPSDAEAAKDLLAKHFDAWVEKRKKYKEEAGPAQAECDDCGKTSEFPASDRGTVQDCPHCGSFLDVPGDDDEIYDWAEAESLPSEEDLEEPPEDDVW
ncbi:hydrogenase maturation nickel metallochaperone HypA [Lignipirellula cremea]|uniref:DUF2007 domain-containing protein n=1 Tax=Lignipirellula cremea TaxID=2528010 RepID=A0A518E0I4_9BACT|nr:hydrogenase maturation nickel metallochaperone HypA [Lignipirellula cremea]QDU97602.1 hypothetical protein Pla8534_54520 [Lignipirellula cremea]